LISFSDTHFPKDVILHAVFFYLRYAVSYRDLEEIMDERGVTVDHATLNRWVIKFSPLIASEAQRRKSRTSSSWLLEALRGGGFSVFGRKIPNTPLSCVKRPVRTRIQGVVGAED